MCIYYEVITTERLATIHHYCIFQSPIILYFEKEFMLFIPLIFDCFVLLSLRFPHFYFSVDFAVIFLVSRVDFISFS